MDLHRLRGMTKPRQRLARLIDDAHVAAEAVRLRGHGQWLETYWFDLHPNFGDRLTQWILPAYGILPRRPGRKPTQAVGVGSVLGWQDSSFNGYVLGSGSLETLEKPLCNARFTAVRGELTRVGAGAPPDTPLGDLGLLAPRVFGTPARVPRIGVIPHLSHRGSEWVERLRADNRIEVIDVRRSPHTVCRQIGACMAIITSSLHGLIVADAYGVPAVWGLPTPILLGSDHKFRDHHTAIGLDSSDRFVDLETVTVDDALGRALTPDDSKIIVVQDLLEEGLRGLHQELSTERRE